MPATGHTFDSDDISIRAKEPYFTQKVNQRDFGVLASGVYQGFGVTADVAALKVSVSNLAYGVAVVPVSGQYNLVVKSPSFLVDLASYTSQTVVLGIIGAYTVSTTSAEVRIYTEAEYLALANPELVVVLARVVVPGSGVIPDANITYKYRTDAWDQQSPGAVVSISKVSTPNSDLWSSTAESNLNWNLLSIAETTIELTPLLTSAGTTTLTTASYIDLPISMSAFNSEMLTGFPTGYEKEWKLRIFKSIIEPSTTAGAGTIRARVMYDGGGSETLNFGGDTADSGSYIELSFVPSDIIKSVRIEFNGYTATTGGPNIPIMTVYSVDLFVPRNTQTMSNLEYTRHAIFRTTFVPESLSSERVDMEYDATNKQIILSARGLDFAKLHSVNGFKAGDTRQVVNGMPIAGLEVADTGGAQRILQAFFDSYSAVSAYLGSNQFIYLQNADAISGVTVTDTTKAAFMAMYDFSTNTWTIGSRVSGDASNFNTNNAPKKYIKVSGGVQFPDTHIGIGQTLASPPDIEHVYYENTIKSKGVITTNNTGSPTVSSNKYNVGAATAVTTTLTVPFATNLSDANYVVNVNILGLTGNVYAVNVLSRAVGNFTLEVNLVGTGLINLATSTGLIIMFTVV